VGVFGGLTSGILSVISGILSTSITGATTPVSTLAQTAVTLGTTLISTLLSTVGSFVKAIGDVANTLICALNDLNGIALATAQSLLNGLLSSLAELVPALTSALNNPDLSAFCTQIQGIISHITTALSNIAGKR
jgi:phage-related protein